MTKKQEHMIVRVDEAKMRADVDNIGRESRLILKKLEGLPAELEDDGDYTVACDLLIGIVEKRKWVDDQKAEAMQDVARLKKRIEALFGEASEGLERAEDYFRKAVEGYALRLARAAHDLRIEAGKAKSASKVAQYLKAAEESEPPKVAGVSFRITQPLEIFEPGSVPDEYKVLTIDETAVRAALELGKAVPGARLTTKIGSRIVPSQAKKEVA